MAAFNQIVVSEKGIGIRSSLQTKDGTAVMESLQHLSPDEARNFAFQLQGAAETCEKQRKQKEEEKENKEKADKKKVGKRKASARSRRANR